MIIKSESSELFIGENLVVDGLKVIDQLATRLTFE